MNNIRAKFEEIWPVPEGVGWGETTKCYFAWYHMAQEDAIAHTARLDTFTRCQETTSIYVGLIDEFIEEVQFLMDAEGVSVPSSCDLIDRAKQILGREK